MAPVRVSEIRVLREENNDAHLLADGVDVCRLHLEYPMVGVVQTRSEGTHRKVGSFQCIPSDAITKR